MSCPTPDPLSPTRVCTYKKTERVPDVAPGKTEWGEVSGEDRLESGARQTRLGTERHASGSIQGLLVDKKTHHPRTLP